MRFASRFVWFLLELLSDAASWTLLRWLKSLPLIEKIERFELDEPDVSLPFTSRLAREQGWTHAYAGRVIFEYKRFMALAVLAGHPVSPSEDVDQAWHLHLVYTKSYWQDLCRDVLEKEIHHSPTVGGAAEGAKFEDWYARTLSSYRRIFNSDPPLAIWPAPEDRFAGHATGRWIDGSKFHPVPRLSWLLQSACRGLLRKLRKK